MAQAAKAQVTKQRFFRVKEGRALIFPEVPEDASNVHLWARPGEIVEASHPVLLAIVERFPHKVQEIPESEVDAKKLSKRMHPSVKARMREHDAGTTSKAKKLATAAGEKAKSAGVDPAKLPSLVPKE